MGFRKELKKYISIPIIDANQLLKPPPLPYATYESLVQRTGLHATLSDEYVDEQTKLDLIHSEEEQIIDDIQIIVYANSEEEAHEKITEIRQVVEYKNHDDLAEKGYGLLEIGSVRPLNKKLSSGYIYRKVLTLKINYKSDIVYEIPNLQAVNIEDPETIRVEREE